MSTRRGSTGILVWIYTYTTECRSHSTADLRACYVASNSTVSSVDADDPCLRTRIAFLRVHVSFFSIQLNILHATLARRMHPEFQRQHSALYTQDADLIRLALLLLQYSLGARRCCVAIGSITQRAWSSSFFSFLSANVPVVGCPRFA